MIIQREWEGYRSVFIYLFSDHVLGRGAGAYVTGVGSEKYEVAVTPALDLTPYEGSYGMRITAIMDSLF